MDAAELLASLENLLERNVPLHKVELEFIDTKGHGVTISKVEYRFIKEHVTPRRLSFQTHRNWCDVNWGSHSCRLSKHHIGPHYCCSVETGCMPYYGTATHFWGEDVRVNEMEHICNYLRQRGARPVSQSEEKSEGHSST